MSDGIRPGQLLKINELKENRAKAVADARALVDKAEAEKRDLTDEERSQYDAMLAEAGKLGDRIKDEERKIELARQEAEIDAGDPETRGDDDRETRNSAALQMDGFRSWLVHGEEEAQRRDAEAFAEFRAQSAGIDTEGGYLVAPLEFVNQLIRDINDVTYIRDWSTVRSLTGATTLGVPTLESSLDDYEWTTEIAPAPDDKGLRFGKRELNPQPLAKLIKISNRLLRLSAQDIEGLVRSEMLLILGYTMEKAFLTGSGANQPLGVFTASPDGIPTSRDVSADNTATALTTDGLARDAARQTTRFVDRSGKLRKSIRVSRKQAEMADVRGTIKVPGGRAELLAGGSRAPHAHLVEFGHGGPHPAPRHPFIEPAVLATQEQQLRAAAEQMRKSLQKFQSERASGTLGRLDRRLADAR